VLEGAKAALIAHGVSWSCFVLHGVLESGDAGED
jgi:hypothetical protein